MQEIEEMLNFYERWPDIYEPVSILSDTLIEPKKEIIACGYGASLIPILIAKEFYNKNIITIYTDGNYPDENDKGKNFVAVSHSGDTYECLESVKKALKFGLNVYVITGGGNLLQFSEKNSLFTIKINRAKTSRLGFPYIMSGLIPLFDKFFEFNVSNEIIKYFSALKSQSNLLKEKALKLAEFFNNGQIVAIYFSNNTKPFALRLRYLLSENAKVHSVYENIMEVAHNGISAWGKKMQIPIILLRSSLDDEITKERFDIINEALSSLNYNVLQLEVKSREEIINTLFMIDLSTIYLAKLKDENPFETKVQEAVRNKIKEKHFS